MPMARQEAQAERKPPLFTDDAGPPARRSTSRSWAAARRSRPATADRTASDDDAIARGGELFRINCSSCHAFGGGGGALSSGKYAPALDDATDRQIYAAMLTGPQNMPVFGDNQLTPEEKRDDHRVRPEPAARQGPGRLGPGPARPGAPRVWRSSWSAWSAWSSRRCGLRGSHEHATRRAHGAEPEPVDVDDPRLTRFDLVREGARRDGVEIVHYEPPFPVPRHQGREAGRAHRRRCCSCSPALAATAFVVVYICWPWEYELGHDASKLYTPMLGLTLGPGPARRRAAAILTWAQEAAARRRSRSRTGTTAPSARGRSAGSPARRCSTWATSWASSAGRCSGLAAAGRPGAARRGRGRPADRRPDRGPDTRTDPEPRPAGSPADHDGGRTRCG